MLSREAMISSTTAAVSTPGTASEVSLKITLFRISSFAFEFCKEDLYISNPFVKSLEFGEEFCLRGLDKTIDVEQVSWRESAEADLFKLEPEDLFFLGDEVSFF